MVAPMPRDPRCHPDQRFSHSRGASRGSVWPAQVRKGGAEIGALGFWHVQNQVGEAGSVVTTGKCGRQRFCP